MSDPLCCPNCKTNRSRFNLIDQQATPVKLDPETGQVDEYYSEYDVAAFHITYNGPAKKVQCASCGLIEDEQIFISYAAHANTSEG